MRFSTEQLYLESKLLKIRQVYVISISKGCTKYGDTLKIFQINYKDEMYMKNLVVLKKKLLLIQRHIILLRSKLWNDMPQNIMNTYLVRLVDI